MSSDPSGACPFDSHGDGFAISPWSAQGEASFQASGADRRAALEAGLRAALRLALGGSARDRAAGDLRAAPIEGRGRDLADLFADLLEALWEQVEFHGSTVHDVRLDGVLPRNGEGFVAWGYVEGPLRQHPARSPRLISPPQVVTDDRRRFVVCASLHRK